MRKRAVTILLIIGFVVGWSLLLTHIPPTEIVGRLGAQNSLLVAFLVSAFGGVSTVTSVNFYTVVLTLAAGGTSPVALGIVAGTGITIGDSLFYYLGTQSHDLLSGRVRRWADSLHEWINDQHESLVQVIAYIYTGLTPLPNDVLTVGLGLAEYSYRRLLPALLLGNITLTILVAEFANRSQLIQKIFGL
jgi:membrane protein YqaA with SNARE-associated domain